MREKTENWTVEWGCNCLYSKQELWISLPVQFASRILLCRQEKALQMLMTRIKDHHIMPLIKPMDSVAVDFSKLLCSTILSHILDISDWVFPYSVLYNVVMVSHLINLQVLRPFQHE